MSLKVWTVANFFILTFIPVPYQVLGNNFVSLFFNAYISFMQNDKSYNIEDVTTTFY